MRMRPTACNTRGPSDAPARSANLVGLRWSRWGKPVATASGMDRGYGATPRSTPVTVTAYGREEHGMSGVGNYRYTKLRITAADGSSRFVVADA